MVALQNNAQARAPVKFLNQTQGNTSLLPTEKSPVVRAIEKQVFTVYGPIKIGKSTFCSQMEDPLFLATEPGLNALNVFQHNIPSWSEFLKVCLELTKDKSKERFQNIIIDTIDNLYAFCREDVLGKAGVDHESDLGYGKGWSLVNTEFERVIKKLCLLGYGVVFISHSKEKEMDSRIGKYAKTVPSLSNSAAQAIMGLSDLVLLFISEPVKDKKGDMIETSVIKTRPSKFYDAGSRWPLPDDIPLNYSAFKEAYQNSNKEEA
ncbi:ATP-binding protein [Candidatus Riflebacteria bacterium]